MHKKEKIKNLLFNNFPFTTICFYIIIESNNNGVLCKFSDTPFFIKLPLCKVIPDTVPFLPDFSRLHQVYTLTKFTPKGGFLRYVKILYKMFRKSLTCADFRVIISPVIRA